MNQNDGIKRNPILIDVILWVVVLKSNWNYNVKLIIGHISGVYH